MPMLVKGRMDQVMATSYDVPSAAQNDIKKKPSPFDVPSVKNKKGSKNHSKASESSQSRVTKPSKKKNNRSKSLVLQESGSFPFDFPETNNKSKAKQKSGHEEPIMFPFDFPSMNEAASKKGKQSNRHAVPSTRRNKGSSKGSSSNDTRKNRDRKEPSLDSFFEATPSVALRAGQAANLYSKDFEMHSKLANRARQRNRRRRVTELRWSDLEVGQLLGSGNFSHVYEVKLLRRRVEDIEEEDEYYDEDGNNASMSVNTINTDVWDMASRWTEAQGPITQHAAVSDIWDLVSHSGTLVEEPEEEEEDDPYYALKHLNPSAMKSERQFKANAIDLVLEAKLLANLNHDNIIKLHAVTGGSIITAFKGGGYFLLLDRLVETLDDRLKKWQKETKDSRSQSQPKGRSRSRPRSRPRAASRLRGRLNGSSSSETTPEQRKIMEERIRGVALGIARGMEYLHSNRLIFRDLKPANVGFNAKGMVKIFDFGLAREIVDPDQRLTGNTGSLRYMAPEVAKHEHYGLKADVYSFGLVLWEILTLKLPFHGLNRVQHSEAVVYGNERPELTDNVGTDSIRRLIESCWDPNPKLRPNFIGVRNTIITELAANRQLETEKWVADVKAETSAARLRTRMRRRMHVDGGYHRFEDGQQESKKVTFS